MPPGDPRIVRNVIKSRARLEELINEFVSAAG
jgi:hypothetical protein